MMKTLPLILALALVYIHSSEGAVTKCATCDAKSTSCEKSVACAAPDVDACIVTAEKQFKCAATADAKDLTVKCEGMAVACSCDTDDCNKVKAGGEPPAPEPSDKPPMVEGSTAATGGDKGGPDTATDGGDGGDGSSAIVSSGILVMIAASLVGWMQYAEVKL